METTFNGTYHGIASDINILIYSVMNHKHCKTSADIIVSWLQSIKTEIGIMKGLFGIELLSYTSVIVKYNYFSDDRESSV